MDCTAVPWTRVPVKPLKVGPFRAGGDTCASAPQICSRSTLRLLSSSAGAPYYVASVAYCCSSVPGIGTSSSQVMLIGRLPAWLRYRTGPR